MQKQNNNTQKLTEHTFSRLMLSSVLGILLCIVCLCSTTFAWFSDGAPSVGNTISTAKDCLLAVTVLDGGVELDNIDEGVVLTAGVEYLVTLSLPADTASGYCIILADGEAYRSEYIRRHDDSVPHEISFILTVGEDKTVTFTSHWGIYSVECSVVAGRLDIP